MPGRDPTSSALHRIGQRMIEHKDQTDERIDKIFTRLDERFDRLEAKVDLKTDQLDRDTQREFSEARRDIGELRDIVRAQGERLDKVEDGKAAQLQASAEGAARGAGQAAGLVAATAARAVAFNAARGFWSTVLGKLVAVAVGFTATVTGIGALPAALRGIEKLWTFLVGQK